MPAFRICKAQLPNQDQPAQPLPPTEHLEQRSDSQVDLDALARQIHVEQYALGAVELNR